jgi:hypothetical protein
VKREISRGLITGSVLYSEIYDVAYISVEVLVNRVFSQRSSSLEKLQNHHRKEDRVSNKTEFYAASD